MPPARAKPSTSLKAIIAGAILLVVVIIAGLIYWRGSSNATTKNDLRIARETIKVEREALKVTSQIDLRVNAEGIQTANTAQEATREIEAIRAARPVPTEPLVLRDQPADPAGSADAARVLQLAREARAAAVASSARLQPAVFPPIFWVTVIIAVVPAICSIAVTGYIANQADSKVDTVKVELKAELAATEGRLGEKIKDIDVNSANRRNESQAEMMRLDESRAQQVMQLRQDLREHISEGKK